MNYALKFTEIEPTDALKASVDEKMEKIGKRTERFGEAVRAEVEIGRTTHHHNKGDVYRAEIRMQLPGGDLYAGSVQDDLYMAIGDVADSIERQLNDYKEFREDVKHLPRPDKE